MNIQRSVQFLIIFLLENVKSTQIAHRNGVQYGKHAEVDFLLEDLKQWTEGPCYKSMHAMLTGVKNSTLWASWAWDSMQRPSGTLYGNRYHLGNYNQCLNPPWKTSHPDLQMQYCLVDFQVTDKEPTERTELDPFSQTKYYIETINNNGRSFNVVTMGVCVPMTCGARAASAIASVLAGIDHTQDPGNAKCEPNQRQYGWKFYAFIGTAAGLILLTVFSTYYNIKSKEKKMDMLASITKPFCIKTNLNDLMKVNNKEIRILNGMRFITAALTVLIHYIVFLVTVPLSNALDFDEHAQDGLLYFIHGDVIIETFLMMSGLLYIKGLLANKNQKIILVLVKRYLRLIGPYAVMTLFMISVYEFIGSGPIWAKFCGFETESCSKYWWLNFLMINSDIDTLCYVVTWYISVDYQLALLATFIFYIYKRNRKFGYISFLAVFILAAVIPGLLTYWNNYNSMNFAKLTDIFVAKTNENLNQVYIKSYSRAGAYLVGVAMGHAMTSYPPENHRNAVSKIWSHIGSIISVFTLWSILSLGAFFKHRTYDPLESAISMAFNRTVWAIAICGLITFSEYGSIPYITNFLSLKMFVPLSRLSYGIYIVHPMIIQKKMFSIHNPLKYDFFDITLNYLGVIALAVFLSLCLHLLVEAPLIKISNLLTARSAKQMKNGDVINGYASHKNNEGKYYAQTKID